MDLKGNPFYLDDAQIAWVETTLSGMTAQEKVGQLFLVMGQDYEPERLLSMVRSAGHLRAVRALGRGGEDSAASRGEPGRGRRGSCERRDVLRFSDDGGGQR